MVIKNDLSIYCYSIRFKYHFLIIVNQEKTLK